MENKIFNTRIKNKKDTEANWTSKNPVLLNGEIIVVDTASGETRFKVGDGAKKYSQLPFQDAATLGNYVPTTRKVNSKALSSDISLTASDVGALPSTTTALKNPKALTFTGAVTGSYDGSASKTVAIPSVDMELDSTSLNPVSNSAVVAGLDEKLDTAGGIVAGISFVDGVIILPENEPTVSTAAITKGYVDTRLSGKLDKSGGTLTGNLSGKYITGTWLQTTEATDLGRTPGKIAVLDDSGWVYYRTPAEIKSDIGANVDTSLSTTSTNPVQNKAVKTELDKKADKTALDNKFDKSGGDISGDVTMSKFLYLNGPLYAYSTILAKTDVQCLYDDNLRIRLACDSSGVAKITTDGAESYARLKIASPTGNDEAATKKYVDDAIKAYVDSAITVAINSSY